MIKKKLIGLSCIGLFMSLAQAEDMTIQDVTGTTTIPSTSVNAYIDNSTSGTSLNGTIKFDGTSNLIVDNVAGFTFQGSSLLGTNGIDTSNLTVTASGYTASYPKLHGGLAVGNGTVNFNLGTALTANPDRFNEGLSESQTAYIAVGCGLYNTTTKTGNAVLNWNSGFLFNSPATGTAVSQAYAFNVAKKSTFKANISTLKVGDTGSAVLFYGNAGASFTETSKFDKSSTTILIRASNIEGNFSLRDADNKQLNAFVTTYFRDSNTIANQTYADGISSAELGVLKIGDLYNTSKYSTLTIKDSQKDSIYIAGNAIILGNGASLVFGANSSNAFKDQATKALDVAGATANLNSSVDNSFDHINFTANGTLNVTLEEGKVLTLKSGVTAAEGVTIYEVLINDFADGDVVFTDSLVAGSDYTTDAQGYNKLNHIYAMNNGEKTDLFYNIDASGNGVVSLVGVAVPEPAEWAAIFGAIALGLAIYRRRK